MFRKDVDVKKRDMAQDLVLKVESAGESQAFLETYEDQYGNAGPVMNLFQGPEELTMCVDLSGLSFYRASLYDFMTEEEDLDL